MASRPDSISAGFASSGSTSDDSTRVDLADGQSASVLVLSESQPSPLSVSTPPRQPRWTDTLAYIANPDAFCRTNLAKYGPVFKTSVFGGTTVFVGASREIQMAFNGDGEYSEIGLPATTMAMFGEHSLFQRPDLHRQRKTALRPAFMGQMLAGYLPHMQLVMLQHLQQWDTQAPIALVPAIEALSFEVLAPLLLGISLDAGDAAFVGLPVASQAELKRLYKTFFDGFYGLVKWRSPLTTFGRGQQARDRLLDFMRALIRQRRAANPSPGQIPQEAPQDFLAMMLASQQADPEGVFSDALIENQCLLQLWASHYEVMGLMASWLYQVGQYPEVVARVRTEVAGVVSPGQPVSLEDLKQLTFLEATIKETLRLLPPSSTATRRLTKSLVLDGVLYEKGWGVVAEPRIAHRMEAYFREPERFDPDRFLGDRGEGRSYEFIPFGGGVHACLGAQLAMTMGKLFAVLVLQRYDWELLGTAKFVQFPLRRIKDDYSVQIRVLS
jgi:retinoid hydroxylase